MLSKVIHQLSDEEAEIAESYMEFEKHPQGSIIVVQFDHCRDVYFLKKGAASVFQLAVLAQRLCALQMADLNGPTVFGETNMVMGQLRNSTIVAVTDTVMYRMPYENYQKMLEEQPKIAAKIMEYIAEALAFRFINAQDRVQSRMVSETKDVNAALYLIKKYLGDVRVCNTEVAQKLFKLDDSIL